MEKLNFVGNGVLRLPPGFRFHPTDEELVVQYLKRKVFSCPLPASIIPEVEVCKYDPWDLPGDSKQERYFFSTREAKYRCGNRSNRATGSGYWKATGLDKRIVASKVNQVVGLKKTLVFYTGKPPHGSRTEWIMHEYRLVGGAGAPDSILPPKKNSIQSCNTSMEDWTLCRIFLKKRNSKNEDEVTQPCNDYKIQNVQVDRPPTFFDFMRKDGTFSVPLSSSSSTASSGITEVSSGVSSDHDESSSCNSFSSPCT